MSVVKGNYHHYYNKRDDLEERMSFFQSLWFESKVCLDIGCNDGLITAEIAQRYRPEFITGIDFDKFLIESAESRLKRARYNLVKDKVNIPLPISSINRFTPRSVKIKRATNTIAPSNAVGADEKSVTTTTSSISIDSSLFISESSCGRIYPENIAFQKKDVFELTEGSGGRYDVILCLSVTKWIHLNGGDDGLLAFFDKVLSLLKFSGIFILEYQPWKSYKKRKDLTPQMEENYQKINLLPNAFEQVLLVEYGFELLEKRYSEESASGFRRPILALRKTERTEGRTTKIGAESKAIDNLEIQKNC